jgi:uncharacterized protein (DUF983 family)
MANNRAGVIPFFGGRCPKCGKGKVFKNNILSFRKFTETNLECSNCKLSFEPETGFFFGAMYWSYAILVGFTVFMSVLLGFLGYFDQAIYIIPVLIVFTLPWVFRWGRLLMLYIVYPLMYKDKFFGKDRDEV